MKASINPVIQSRTHYYSPFSHRHMTIFIVSVYCTFCLLLSIICCEIEGWVFLSLKDLRTQLLSLSVAWVIFPLSRMLTSNWIENILCLFWKSNQICIFLLWLLGYWTVRKGESWNIRFQKGEIQNRPNLTLQGIRHRFILVPLHTGGRLRIINYFLRNISKTVREQDIAAVASGKVLKCSGHKLIS
jgi:hypothetical protein